MKASRLLWAVILISTLAAGAAAYDWYLQNRESPGLVGRPLIGEVDLRHAGIVLIETAGGQVTLRRSPWGWTVDEQHGFAADTGKLRALLLRMAGTQLAQRVNVRPGRLGDLGLLQKVENEWRFEEGRTASVFTVTHGMDNRHRLMVQVLVGNRRPGLGTYVRFPEDNTPYLVAGALALDGDATHWIQRNVFAPDAAAAMAEIRVQAPGRRPLVFSRADAQAAWRLAGAKAAPQAAQVEALARTLGGLRVAAVGPQADEGAAPPLPAGAATVAVRFFDGRVVTAQLHPDATAQGRPAVLQARLDAAAATREVQRKVTKFNATFARRPVELDAAQAARLLQARAAYLAGE